ncbi:MAG: YggT family protein [Burkholderiales bacterium]
MRKKMLSQALQFLLNVILSLFLFTLLLRFYLAAVRAPSHNPISQFTVAFTDFAVRPLRNVLPASRSWDWATLTLAWVTAFLLLAVSVVFASGGGFRSDLIPALAIWALIHLLRWGIYIVMGATLIQAILSWVNPYSPIAPVLDAMTRPFLRPIQQRVPMVGNVDLSPLIVLVLCQLLLIVPVAALESAVARGLLH